MRELASPGAFRECAEHRASAPGFPGNVKGTGLFESLGRDAGLSERSDLVLDSESVPPPFSRGAGENSVPRDFFGLRNGPSRHHSRPLVSSKTYNSLIQNRLFSTPLWGQAPPKALHPSPLRARCTKSKIEAGINGLQSRGHHGGYARVRAMLPVYPTCSNTKRMPC